MWYNYINRNKQTIIHIPIIFEKGGSKTDKL